MLQIIKNFIDFLTTPTISFTFNNKSSKNLSKELVNYGIATRNDNFYAWRCLDSLNISRDDGVVRLSMVHYNKLEETEKIIDVLDKEFK